MAKVKKYKICRRLGSSVFSKCENPRFSSAPKQQRGRKSGRGGRTLSEFGAQLLDKQRARYTYNVRERQFANYVRKASAKKGANPREALFCLLETRLDNVIFRFGITKSRAGARQMISHGHILVNEKKVTIPSYEVRPGDTVRVRPQSKNIALLRDLSERNKDYSPPVWLTFDAAKLEGKIKALPQYDLASAEALNFTSVMEFYGR